MKVTNILDYKGTTLYKTSPETNLITAIDSLNYYHVGALMVMESDKIRGIITERDILGAISKYKSDILKLKVSDLMTRSLITCTVDDDLEKVMDIMTNSHIRHVPVLEDKKLVGIISIGDIVEALLHHRNRAKSRK
jgi:CBS domain-containing protein